MKEIEIRITASQCCVYFQLWAIDIIIPHVSLSILSSSSLKTALGMVATLCVRKILSGNLYSHLWKLWDIVLSIPYSPFNCIECTDIQ